MSKDARHDRNTENSKDDWRFDEEGNMVDAQGGVMVPHQIVHQYLSSRQRQHQQQQYSMQPSRFRERLGSPSALANRRRRALQPQQNSHLSSASSSSPTPDRDSRTNRIVLPVASRTNNQAAAHDQPAGHRPSLAVPSTNNTYSVAAPAYSDTARGLLANNWLPQDASSGSANYNSTFPADNDISWYPLATIAPGQPGLVYGRSPRHSREPLTPSIRLTSPDVAGAQPQDTNFSTSPMQQSLPPYPCSSFSEHNSGHLSPQGPYSMPPDVSENMQTPVSPVSAHSPHDTTMEGQQISRKRSHSEMSQNDTLAHAIQQQTQPQPQPHSRSGSVASQLGASPNGANDGFNPRGSHAFKRGEPPSNDQGKYICEFAEECLGIIFDRKCEWSKHMDKHDRPYRCPHPSCAKLQGFTYSGGLLRHEREVHGKHGGPKAPLMCPVADCKRHSGKGFTRKENLNEHLRRVHPGIDASSQPSQPILLKHDATDVTIGAGEDGETPASMGTLTEVIDQQQDHYIASPAIGHKRKRSLAAGFEVDFPPDHEPELKRLRQLVQEQEERIRSLDERIKVQDAHAMHAENRMQELEGQTTEQAEKILRMESELAEANIRSQLVSANSAVQ